MPTLAREFNVSLSTVHGYIEEQRKLLRAQTIDLAAQERDQALGLLDLAIEKVVPHIKGDIEITSSVKTSKGKLRHHHGQTWEARMKACEHRGEASGSGSPN